MSKKILAQEEEIKKQVLLYRQQTEIKTQEEKELAKVLADYRKKYDEFSKAMKKSRETFKTYEGEIKNLNFRANELAALKKKLSQGDKKRGGLTVAQIEADIEKQQAEWAKDKEALLAEKEKLAAFSNELMEKIKAAKAAKQA